MRVDVTSEAVYEIVAEPIPEPQEGEPQAEAAAEPDPEDLVNPADLQGKLRSIILISICKVYISICAFTF